MLWWTSYRQNHRLEHKSLDDMDGYKAEGMIELGEMVGNQLEHQQILRVLKKLKADYQSVLILRFISELSPEETAQVMKRSVGAIRVLQHRALNALRQEIDRSD